MPARAELRSLFKRFYVLGRRAEKCRTGILGVALVQSDLNAMTEFGVLQPLQGKKRSFDATEFAQVHCQPVLGWVGAQLPAAM